MGGLIIGIILILVGLSILTGVHFLGLFVALVLIVIGVRFIMRRSSGGPGGSGPGGPWSWQGNSGHPNWHHPNANHLNSSHEDTLNEVVVFSALDKKIISDNFTGGKVVLVFSGGDLDLTAVKTSHTEIELELSCTFSGLDIVIPKEWKVRSNVKVAMGSVELHTAPGGDGNVTLVLKGDAVCSGIDVWN